MSARTALLAMLAVSIAALVGAPGAVADDCPQEDGWVCGVTAPPVPPDQAGNPQAVTIDWTTIPGVPPSVSVPLGLPAPPHKACKHKRKHAATAKKCKKRHRPK
jgi:hypothetical protein